MIINIIAKPGKKKEYVEQLTKTTYVVAVKAPAREGRANQAILVTLAEYFGIARNQIRLVSGQTSKQKRVEVPETLANFEKSGNQKKLF